jgi:hypothetical protein
MRQTLESVLERLAEPDTPVVWLDPATKQEIWDNLPGLLEERGYRVIAIREDQAVSDLPSLLEALWKLTPLPEHLPPTLENLKQSMIALPHDAPAGIVVIFRSPSQLRQADEAGFEAFVDVLESIGEAHASSHQGIFKLVVSG